MKPNKLRNSPIRPSHFPIHRAFPFAAGLLLASGIVIAALAGSRPGPKKSNNLPFNIQVQQTVVQVPVVVHDALGKPVPDLTKNDFVLLDNGKPQTIGYFTVGNTKAITEALKAPQKSPKKQKQAADKTNLIPPGLIAALAKGQLVPTRFVAVLFDDDDMEFSQLARTLAAAEHFLNTSLTAGDRVAFYTTSGKEAVDFTSDGATLDAAIQRLQHEDVRTPQSYKCPPLSDYEAFLIAEENDKNALTLASTQLIDCRCSGNPLFCSHAKEDAQNAAQGDWAEAEQRAGYTVEDLECVVERLEAVPGQRSIVFVSSGFNSWAEKQEIDDIINRALRANIVVNTLDSKGVWALIPSGSARRRGILPPHPVHTPTEPPAQFGVMVAGGNLPPGGVVTAMLDKLRRDSQVVDSGVLEALAEGTGGVWFHNNNDMNEGFTEAGGLPQTTYVLAFSPSDLQANGKYHKLEVKFATSVAHHGWTIQARKGYYAPSGKLTSAERIHQQIKRAVFSQAEVAGLPIHVETSSVQSKSTPTLSRLTVTTKLQVSALHFNASAGKQVDDITFVTAVFDINGKFVSGKQRRIQFTLTDPALKEVRARGLMIPMRFDLASGTYLVRVVVRDANGALAAQSVQAVIPSS